MSLIQNRKTKRQVKRGYLQSASLLAHNTISCYRSISEEACTVGDFLDSVNIEANFSIKQKSDDVSKYATAHYFLKFMPMLHEIQIFLTHVLHHLHH